MGVYKPDRNGIARMLRDEKLLGPAMLERAEAVAQRAREISPYDSRSKDHFRDHFHASVGLDNVVSERGTHKGVVGTVTNDDPNAISIEVGTQYQEGHFALTDALHEVIEGE